MLVGCREFVFHTVRLTHVIKPDIYMTIIDRTKSFVWAGGTFRPHKGHMKAEL